MQRTIILSLITLLAIFALSSSSLAMYNTEQGRFMQRDPLGERDGICLIEFSKAGRPVFPRTLLPKIQYKDGAGLYEYVKSNSMRYTDNFGNAACPYDGYLRPEKKPIDEGARWIKFGYTKATKWHVKTGPKDCAPIIRGCTRIKILECFAKVRGWYLHPAPTWLKDTAGNSPLQHENNHVRIYRAWWGKVKAKVNEVENLKCMRMTIAKCYKKALNEYRKAYKILADAENYGFDCDVYDDGPERDEVCALEDTEREEGETQLNKAKNMWKSCEKK